MSRLGLLWMEQGRVSYIKQNLSFRVHREKPCPILHLLVSSKIGHYIAEFALSGNVSSDFIGQETPLLLGVCILS